MPDNAHDFRDDLADAIYRDSDNEMTWGHSMQAADLAIKHLAALPVAVTLRALGHEVEEGAGRFDPGQRGSLDDDDAESTWYIGPPDTFLPGDVRVLVVPLPEEATDA